VLLNVGIVINLWTNIESFLGMDSYLCEDSEELYRRYDVVGPGVDELFGIVRIYELAMAGRTEDVLECLRNGENIHKGLEGACYGGHMKLVELMIEMGASGGDMDFDRGLESACFSGQKEMVEFMIERGAKNLNYGLEIACCVNNKEIALLMIEKGAVDLNNGLEEACYSHCKEMAELMIEKGATNFNKGLEIACYVRNKEIALLMIEKGALDEH
jgi:hypothetical protein